MPLTEERAMPVDFLKTAAKALRLRLPGPNPPCHSHCRQLVAAGFGRKTAESTYPERQPLRPHECSDWRNNDNAMLFAEAIILDRDTLLERCVGLGLSDLLGIILQATRDAVSQAAQELNPSSPPVVYFRLKDFIAARTQGAQWHLPASMLVGTRQGQGFFLHYPYASLVVDSVPDMPAGYAPGDDGQYHDWYFPALLRIEDHYWDHLSPEAQIRFPHQRYPTEVVVTVAGARGVSFGDCLEPQAPGPQWEDDDVDGEEDEGPDDMTPTPGATCEHHPDRLAVIDVEYGPLCDDCAEHYLSGYIRD